MNWIKKLFGIGDCEDDLARREEEIERRPLTVQPPRSHETAAILLEDIRGKIRAYIAKRGREPQWVVMSRANWELLRDYPLPLAPRVKDVYDGFEVG